MMKRLALILVVVLLCEVMSTEAARRKSPGGAANQKRVTCGGKLCEPGDFCSDFTFPPGCARVDTELIG
ncbi:hypothetical protein MTO96_001798 [Rhipicephalus appendiculatus]